MTTDQATSLVRGVADQVITLIKAPGTPASKAPQLRAIMDRNVAMRDVAGFVLGRYARQTSPDQRDRYVEAYKDYVARTYAARFSEYGGQTIDVTGAQDYGSKGVYVSSTTTYNGQVVNIGWQVREDRNGQPQINDIVVDGLSMIESQRSDFARLIQQQGGDIDAFIQRLQTL